MFKKVTFIASASQAGQRAGLTPYPEIAFCGRSNVGKSSLINALCGSGAARVSKTPGRTRLINTFLIEDSFYLIDLPGYGYAKASKKEQEEWGKTIPDYITNSPNLKLALVLTDFRIPPQQSDAAMCAFLRAQGIPHTVVATKADGLPKGKWHKQKLDLAFACKLTFAEDICVTSAKSGHGIDALVKKLKGII